VIAGAKIAAAAAAASIAAASAITAGPYPSQTYFGIDGKLWTVLRATVRRGHERGVGHCQVVHARGQPVRRSHH